MHCEQLLAFPVASITIALLHCTCSWAKLQILHECASMCASSSMTLQGQQSEWALLKRHPCEDIFGVQVCGSHPDSVSRCVQLLVRPSTALSFQSMCVLCAGAALW